MTEKPSTSSQAKATCSCVVAARLAETAIVATSLRKTDIGDRDVVENQRFVQWSGMPFEFWTTRGRARRRSAASAVGLPVETVVLLILIVARCCVKQCSCRFWPVHPLCSIRRSQGRGASHPIALPACKLLEPTVPYPYISDVLSPPGGLQTRLRVPPSFSWRDIGACWSPGPQNTRVVARILSP